MQITRQADYAVRAVLYLAQRDPRERASTAEIAREQKIPPTFLAKIISQLSAARIVHAARGAHGGVMLARAADHISVLEVLEAMDGPIRLNECVGVPQACPVSDVCPIQKVWCTIQADLVERLAATRFGQFRRTPAVTSLSGS